MNKILIIGAGRSATSLIDYLLKNAVANNWFVTVSDFSLDLAQSKIKGFSNCVAKKFDVNHPVERETIIKEHDLIISMLPASMHAEVARDCVKHGKHMATASYVSDEMKKLDAEAKQKGILLLNEIGLDPGIDHASAMKIIDGIHSKGGEITLFKSYCGGLVAPESNNNPWGYKFSWNPRNVVVAGQGGAHFLENGNLKNVSYNDLFKKIENISIEGYGNFDGYANRDSISYKEPCHLKNIKTLLRGTLRQNGYCKAWNVFVQLGLTDNSYKIKNTSGITYTELLESKLPKGNNSLKEKLKSFFGNDIDENVFEKLNYLELFGNKKIKLSEGSPAELLQNLLEEKWKLNHGDKDMIVMQHQFEYFASPPAPLRGERGAEPLLKKITSSLVVIGDDEIHTAMAKTVGLPLAITVKNFLTGKFKLNGVQIPTVKEIYEPLLKELEEFKIVFKEEEF